MLWKFEFILFLYEIFKQEIEKTRIHYRSFPFSDLYLNQVFFSKIHFLKYRSTLFFMLSSLSELEMPLPSLPFPYHFKTAFQDLLPVTCFFRSPMKGNHASSKPVVKKPSRWFLAMLKLESHYLLNRKWLRMLQIERN